MPYYKLVDYYNLSSLGVWPAQESTSQIDILACGKPIIITNKSGTPDRAIDSGYLYNHGSSRDLADKILKVKDSKNYKNFCFNAEKKARELYNWEVIAKEYISDYKIFFKKINNFK